MARTITGAVTFANPDGSPRSPDDADGGDSARTHNAADTGAGKPIERTVLSEADAIARHERSHVKQIARVVNR